jgi:15-cis-phytoene synthase
MLDLYTQTTQECSRLITERYSTSFTLGIKTLDKRFRPAIFSIYGYVRYADEIVDTFHSFDKKTLLTRFRKDTYLAIAEGISLNPVLHAFQLVVKQYKIERELIDAFLHSMEMDLYENSYSQINYEEYIYGSAEVVGLMCLRVFCEGNEQLYQQLKADARSLGAAFQKVNFLRDIKSDFIERGRTYFPNISFEQFDERTKTQIESDIQYDFEAAYRGIKRLPDGARMGVYLAYIYYLQLFKKIKHLSPKRISEERIRVPDIQKMLLLAQSYIKFQLNVI